MVAQQCYETKNIPDNEALDELPTAIRQHGIDYEKVPPHIHCRNISKKGFRTFKDILNAILARVNKISNASRGKTSIASRNDA